ncbi:hypothetical protein Tco_0178819 [Tanacetum coccineum]
MLGTRSAKAKHHSSSKITRYKKCCRVSKFFSGNFFRITARAIPVYRCFESVPRNLARNGESAKFSINLKLEDVLLQSFSCWPLKDKQGWFSLLSNIGAHQFKIKSLDHWRLDVFVLGCTERELEFGFSYQRINALTISFSSATSDETVGVEELILTFATMAMLRD